MSVQYRTSSSVLGPWYSRPSRAYASGRRPIIKQYSTTDGSSRSQYSAVCITSIDGLLPPDLVTNGQNGSDYANFETLLNSCAPQRPKVGDPNKHCAVLALYTRSAEVWRRGTALEDPLQRTDSGLLDVTLARAKLAETESRFEIGVTILAIRPNGGR